jgi:hypothetical protein
VEWEISQGKTTGEVVKKLTSRTKIKSHRAAASKNLVQRSSGDIRETTWRYRLMNRGTIPGSDSRVTSSSMASAA